MEPTTLDQAGTSNNVAGALQQMLLQRVGSPQQSEEANQRRLTELGNYQQALRSDPSPGYSALDHSLYSWIDNIGRAGSPQLAAVRGVAAGGRFMGDRARMLQQGDVAAAKVGYEDAKNDEQNADKLLARASGGNLAGKAPSPEALRTVYTSARNEAAQIAKNYNFNSAEEQSRWVEQQANLAVENYMRNFATQPAGPRGVGGVASVTKPSEQPQDESPTGLAEPANQLASVRLKPSVESPVPRNKAEEARVKEYATGTEKSALKDYEDNVRPAAQTASSMLDTIGMVRQIPRTQDMFAPYREKLGSAMNALGMDGAMVKEAQSLQQVRPMLAKIANDRLLMAKGVQTEGDAQRAYNEFVQITDTQQAADFMYAWAEELANRAKFKDKVYKLSANEKGTMREGSNYWDQTDYAQAAPVALLNGKPWTFTAWRNAFTKANPEAGVRDALETWNKLAGRK